MSSMPGGNHAPSPVGPWRSDGPPSRTAPPPPPSVSPDPPSSRGRVAYTPRRTRTTRPRRTSYRNASASAFTGVSPPTTYPSTCSRACRSASVNAPQRASNATQVARNASAHNDTGPSGTGGNGSTPNSSGARPTRCGTRGHTSSRSATIAPTQSVRCTMSSNSAASSNDSSRWHRRIASIRATRRLLRRTRTGNRPRAPVSCTSSTTHRLHATTSAEHPAERTGQVRPTAEPTNAVRQRTAASAVGPGSPRCQVARRLGFDRQRSRR